MAGPNQSAAQPHHTEIPVLSDDMTRADLIDVLEHLPQILDCRHTCHASYPN